MLTFLYAYKLFFLLEHSSFIRFTSLVLSYSCNAGSPRLVLEVCYIEINRRVLERQTSEVKLPAGHVGCEEHEVNFTKMNSERKCPSGKPLNLLICHKVCFRVGRGE